MEAFPLQWPIDWPRTNSPIPSRFGNRHNKPTIAYSRDFLLEELKRMGAQNPIISTNLELKGDGLPYSNQKNPTDKGVAVYFTYKKTAMVIACDSFDNIACNITGIAKTIEAMRGIERWGCSEMMNKAFTGFKALASGIPMPAKKRDWWEVLKLSPTANAYMIKEAYRTLSKEKHPDAGGTTEDFQELTEAYNEGFNNLYK